MPCSDVMMDDSDYQALLEQLTQVEGQRLAPYRGANGDLIVAAGNYVEAAGLNPRKDVTVLEADARCIAQELGERWPTFSMLDPIRQRVLVHMALNTTVVGLLMMRRLIAAIEVGYWELAAEEMLLSHWGMRDGRRANALAVMMRGGQDQSRSVDYNGTYSSSVRVRSDNARVCDFEKAEDALRQARVIQKELQQAVEDAKRLGDAKNCTAARLKTVRKTK